MQHWQLSHDRSRVCFCLPIILIIGFLLISGCGSVSILGGGGGREASSDAPKLRGVNLTDVSTPTISDDAVQLSAAKNEWTSFTLQLSALPPDNGNRVYTLRMHDLNHETTNTQISASNYTAFQILSMPVDVNRAGYVRHTGLRTSDQQLPRALLPVPINNGEINLSALRDSSRPTDPQGRASGSGQPALLWIDLHIPPEAKPGDYSTVCDVLETGVAEPVSSVTVKLSVHDFVLPDERHLMMVGQLNWSDLSRLYPDRFEAVTPRLVNRTDDRYRQAVRTMDELILLAQQNRVQLAISRLQPSVKWFSGKPPRFDWDDYDSLVTPWLKGDVFPDRVPLGYWPMPPDEHLANYDQQSQRQYWAAVASHFDQLDWINRSAVTLEPDQPGGRADTLESVKLSADAAAILRINPRLRVVVPLEDDQVVFASDAVPNLIQKESASRLITANPGLVFASPLRTWPEGVPRPQRWLRTDLTGLIPYVGAGGDERDVRLWAWLATVPLPPPPLGVQYGGVKFVRWGAALPAATTPHDPADPNDLIWFYPGSWFGVDTPVPTMQLKWLRRAQQDYEYIYLARQRGDTINALLMARLMTKPVELAPSQAPDPTYGLMCGTADPKAWSQATDLLAQRILMREPGQSTDPAAKADHLKRENELNLQTLRWGEPQERPVIMGRSAQWLYAPPSNGAGPAGVDLKLGVDIYNASDRTPDENSLQWTDGPAGWHWRPEPISIPQLATYHVRRFEMVSHVEPTEVKNTEHTPNTMTFTDGFTRLHSVLQMVLPVAISDRREGKLNIDGDLQDWTPDDAIQNGPLVKMFDRPSLQSQQMQFGSTPTQIFTGWADENFYVAFKVKGISTADARSAQNWINYQFRRAWGEDLCQIMIQAVYADGSIGPLLHVALKPNAQSWVERKLDPHLFADPWQTYEDTGLRYARTLYDSDWRGEVAIPWKAIDDPKHNGRPVMLRFNFTQHKTTDGESASWAGPIDFGRDDAFTGLLFLREPNNPGMEGGPNQ